MPRAVPIPTIMQVNDSVAMMEITVWSFSKMIAKAYVCPADDLKEAR